jgi:hypothetical protein
MREIGEARQSAHELLPSMIQDATVIILIGPDLYTYTLPKLKENNFSGDIHSTLSSRDA